MFLLGTVVLARARDMQTECVSIELQTRFSVSDDDRRVVDTEKQFIFHLPLLIALAFRKLQNLEPVLVRIAEVKRFDAPRILVPVRQTLWTSRSVLDFVLTQQCVRLVHVARDDRNVLKPA